MTDIQKLCVLAELRSDFQIPPYFEDETICRAISERYARLSFLAGINFDVDDDLIGRNLLKNAVYYEINHRYEEFEKNYLMDILSWQLGGDC